MEEINKGKKDMLVGGISVSFGIVFYALTYTFKLVDPPNTVNAAFFPRVLGIAAVILGVIIFCQGLRVCRKADQTKSNTEGGKISILRVIGVAAVLLIASLTMKQMGFILTMPWMLFTLFLLVNKKSTWKLPLYAVLSIALPIAVFFLFYYVFATMLPMGLLKNFLSTYFL